jgi:bifunctional ADP-heptose synthase (sugar kinase/adenylyltransferase)
MITIIGESCTDIYVYTKSTRLSPEAPVPVLIPIHKVKTGGMAMNVYNNIKNMDSSIDVKLITHKNKIKKKRYVDHKTNHSFIRIDTGEDDVDPYNGDVQNNYGVTIISDYNKGYLTDANIINISDKSMITILDTKRRLTKDIIDSVDYIKLNEGEYMNNKDLINDENINKFIITMGGKGASHNGILYLQENDARTIDVSGAGDTFTAALGLAIHNDKSLSEAIIMANKMSYKVVLQRGTSLPL